MTITPIVDHSPGAMSRRARVYIITGGVRHLLVGLFMLVAPWLFSAAAFIPIFNLLPLNVWGAVMAAVGLVCIVGAFTRNGDIARTGIVGSATITLVLAVGVAVGVTAVWIQWLDVVTWDRALALFFDRPVTMPVALLNLSAAPPSPFLPILMLAVTVKDFTMCAQPLRVPFEDRAQIAPIQAV